MTRHSLVPPFGIIGAVLLSAVAMTPLTTSALADGVREAPRRAAPARVQTARKKAVYRKTYVYRENGWCAMNMRRLRNFEREVRNDGRVSEDEMRIALSLKADLALVCGRTHAASRHWDR